MFEEGFPVYLAKELHNVLGVISVRAQDLDYMNIDMDRWYNEEYLLLDDGRISFPDRICFADDKEAYDKLATKEEKLIYILNIRSMWDVIFTEIVLGIRRSMTD